MPRPRCRGLTYAGQQCSNQSYLGSVRTTCRIHAGEGQRLFVEPVVPPVQLFYRCSRAGLLCPTVVREAVILCDACLGGRAAVHYGPRQAVIPCLGYRTGHVIYDCINMPVVDGRCQRCNDFRAQRMQIARLLADEEAILPLRHWQDVARDLYRRVALGELTRPVAWSVARRYALHRGVDTNLVMQFLYPIAAPPQPQEDLARLAHDRQNVHTRHVSAQTNKGVQILLNTPVPDEQSTLHDITFRWMLAGTFDRTNQLGTLLIDMDTFYHRETCRSEGDFLYRRLLDGLHATITLSPNRDELSKRLYEEILESAGLCMDGHITRLINVLVGFHPDFASPTSLIDVLGDRFAALASVADLTTAVRRERGLAILTELGIPDYDHAPWLDAL